MIQLIDCKKFYYAYLSGAKKVMENKNDLNKINVFPVADGDTGSNLSSTMNAIIKESRFSKTIKRTMESIASAAVNGARGNSGIIFAQYLNGISIEMKNEDSLTIENFVNANNNAVKYAYSAIANPVEGTMITVIKDWADSLHERHKITDDFIEILTYSYERLEKSLKATQQKINVLRKAKVVDSGAKGFAIFIEGFLDFLKSGKDDINIEEFTNNVVSIDYSHMIHSYQEISYRYCTEAIIKGVHINHLEIKDKLKDYGDSLIIAGCQKNTRIHIHTDFPSKIFKLLNTFGEVTYQKVDDMKKQNDVFLNRKHPIAIVTDSVADLPQNYIDEKQIHIIHLNLLLKNSCYLDKLTVDNEMVLSYFEKSEELPTSSQPSFKSVQNLFAYLLTYYESIIVLAISQKLSGTFSVFKKVAEQFNKDNEKITVINTKQNSAAEGLLVMKCVKELEKGRSKAEIVNKMDEYINKSKILVSVKTLDNMIRSGRLGTLTGKIAKKINLKPVITLNKEGSGDIEAITFTCKASLEKSIKKLKIIDKSVGIDSYSIVHVENEKEAIKLAQVLEKVFSKKPKYIENTSSIIAIGAGRGAVAVAYITK